MIIENFAELSEKEQLDFAQKIIDKINADFIFTGDTKFTISEVYADELSGDLNIEIDHEDYIEVAREASWTCDDEDEVYSVPKSYDSDIEYEQSIMKDAEKAFKTLSTTIDDYLVTLTIGDAYVEEIEASEVSDYSNEDAGIGHYDYWGTPGYDSRPYVQVEGTLYTNCSMGLTLSVGVPQSEPKLELER